MTKVGATISVIFWSIFSIIAIFLTSFISQSSEGVVKIIVLILGVICCILFLFLVLKSLINFLALLFGKKCIAVCQIKTYLKLRREPGTDNKPFYYTITCIEESNNRKHKFLAKICESTQSLKPGDMVMFRKLFGCSFFDLKEQKSYKE